MKLSNFPIILVLEVELLLLVTEKSRLFLWLSLVLGVMLWGFFYDKRQVPEDVFYLCAILNVSRIIKAATAIDPLV